MISDIFLILGSLLLTISNIYIFIVGRIIGGLGCGLTAVAVTNFLKQMTPPEIYGLIGGINVAIYVNQISNSI